MRHPLVLFLGIVCKTSAPFFNFCSSPGSLPGHRAQNECTFFIRAPRKICVWGYPRAGVEPENSGGAAGLRPVLAPLSGNSEGVRGYPRAGGGHRGVREYPHPARRELRGSSFISSHGRRPERRPRASLSGPWRQDEARGAAEPRSRSAYPCAGGAHRGIRGYARAYP